MANRVSYQVKQYKNSNSSYNNFYYPRAVITGEMDLNDIAEKVQQNCSLKKSDVMACLTELVDVMRDALMDSKRVRINGLGMFKIGIVTKKMVEKLEDFKVSECIGGYRVNFLPEYYRDADGKTVKKLISGARVAAMDDYVEGVNKMEGKKKIEVGRIEG